MALCGSYVGPTGASVRSTVALRSPAAEVDANFVLSADGGLVEIQATGEERPFSRAELNQILDLAEAGCQQLFTLQAAAVRGAL